MKTLYKYIAKKGEEYFLIEQNFNPHLYSFEKLEGENADLYNKSVFVYVDANTKELVDITEFNPDNFVNTNWMLSEYFLNSEFFTNNKDDILLRIILIYKKQKENKLVDLKDKTCYKVLTSTEFLTSEYAKKHYKEIYDTLNNKNNSKENKKTKSKRVK